MDLLDRISLQFFGWFFPFLSVLAGGYLWLHWKRGNASVWWPSVQGEILLSEVESDDEKYSPRIEYRYAVDGVQYKGDTLTYRGYGVDRKTAEFCVSRFPAKSTVPVYYDPGKPSVSVLEQGVDPADYLIALAVLLVVFVAGVALKIWLLLN